MMTIAGITKRQEGREKAGSIVRSVVNVGSGHLFMSRAISGSPLRARINELPTTVHSYTTQHTYVRTQGMF